MVDDAPRMLGDRYEVGALLGRGGMAEVHLGRDTRLGRRVAIKMLRSDFARDPVFQARFRREAQSAAALNHPNVVAVYDTGEDVVTESGGAQARVPYIVMEYVEGHTARDLLHNRPAGPDGTSQGVGVEEAITITLGVLEALEYSHRAGIVHRDIKPGNVMITPRGDIKVMDFGIARAVADSSATMTQSQAVIGTAQYLSPEQARGETVDARSDLYSAGCLLYELLTGRPPFVGDSPVSVAYQHVREVPQPPSSLNPEVPEAVDRVVLHALAKERGDRYPDAAAFRRDLIAARDGRPVSAPAVAAAAAAAAAATQALPGVGTAATQAMPAAATGATVPVGAPPAPPTETITARDVQDPPPRRRRRAAGYVGLALAVIAVFAVAALLTSNLVGGTSTTEQVQVPRLIGMTAPEAKAALDELELEYAQGEDVEDTEAEPGTVVDQTPEERTTVDVGTTVTVRLAAAPGNVNVPDLEGRTQEEARTALQELGLEPGVVTTEDSPDHDAGQVVRTIPPAGQSVPEGTQIDLVLSSGQVELPDLVGTPYPEARAELLDLGLQVVIERQPTDEQEPDAVVSQDPAPGRVERGSVVTLVVADPLPEPSTPTTSAPTTTTPPAEPSTPPTTEPAPPPTPAP
ncbi:Stk1 family PASTA domain-containing Ser/Thr kinase [Quadrisphaera sp. GCM10027208]|uniref:Stk1 family PASTA domain-containing Ser/Thr kinase n=1 Tax=Quadrisphaera sp. GCM10027208 TaxID=3273423 RepID=UPI0036137B18